MPDAFLNGLDLGTADRKISSLISFSYRTETSRAAALAEDKHLVLVHVEIVDHDADDFRRPATVSMSRRMIADPEG
ncbi:hypothetical protein [Saccharopolyspora hattusasensis]|uniref:hypothetical protein n=1 Tax=Saccharopolyspora hattusasensis TaxID=1128679 RepID=UPI003D950DAF